MHTRLWTVTLILAITGCSAIPGAQPTAGDYWTNAGFNPEAPTPAPGAMACKMLKASVCAYDIETFIDTEGTTDGTLPLTKAGSREKGFCGKLLRDDLIETKGSRPNQDGDTSPRDAGFIALMADSKVVIALRGTLPIGSDNLDTVAKDWVNDANAKPVDLQTNDPSQAKVHKGFMEALEKIRPELYKWIDTWKAEGKLTNNFDLYVTGHSKGGAMAFIAALELLRAGYSVTGVYTYAAARAGDTNFRRTYGRIPTWRYENQDDVVPHLPATQDEIEVFRGFDDKVLQDLATGGGHYVSLGDLVYITEDVKLIKPGSSREAELDKLRVGLFKKGGNLESLIAAHSSQPPQSDEQPSNLHRYWRAVCGQ